MHCRHDRNAKVVVSPADPNAHTPVLRKPALGNIQAAHDFEARSQRELHLLRRRRGVHEHAIYAVTKAKRLFKWLDMNIARAVFDGLNQDQVRQFDDRRFFAGSRQLIEIDFFQRFPRNLNLIGIRIFLSLLLGILDDVLHAAALGGINVVQLLDDRLF